jgi:predicted transcriptional regulator YdeE
MNTNFKEVHNLEKQLIGLSAVLPVKDENSERLFAFYDTIVADKSYETLFSSQKKDIGEWNLYAMNKETEKTDNYLYVTAAEVSEYLDFKKLHGLKVDIINIHADCWLVFRVASVMEAGALQAKMVEENGLKELGYSLAYGEHSPIMEFQPQSCTQTPEYVELWIPVHKL